MENESLDLIIKEVENQQEKELVRFESNLSEGINKYKEVLPADLITPQLQEKIDNEVKLQLVEFQKSIDLKNMAWSWVDGCSSGLLILFLAPYKAVVKIKWDSTCKG